MRDRLSRLLVRLTPPRWRDSIAGDLEEERGGNAVLAWHGARLVTRLWFEEVMTRRAAPQRRRRSFMQALSLHVRQAVRALIKRPAYSLIVIATLAIGIGANASVFTLVNWLMLRPLTAVEDPTSLVTMRFAAGRGGTYTISHVEMQMVAEQLPAVAAIAGSMEAPFNLAADGTVPARVQGAIVSANYFDLLGVRPTRGRAFAGTEPGVVISHDYWQSRLGGAPDIIGRTALVNGHAFPIVGVAPRGFTGTSRSSLVQVWVPSHLKARAFTGNAPNPLTDIEASLYIDLFGRLQPGATIDDVSPRLEGAHAAIMRTHPQPGRIERMHIEAGAGIAEPAYQRARFTSIFSLLMTMVALLLILTCANVGNVVLANSASRRAEIATRQALGASRRSIVTSVIVECVLLSLAGAIVAIAIAAAVGRLMRGTIVIPWAAALGDVALDIRVFVFAFVVATLAAAGAGLLPALAATRFDLISTLKGAGRTLTAGSHRLRRTLLVAQVAVSLALLVGALLLARSIHERSKFDPGFDASRLITFSIEPGLHTEDEARRRSLYANLMQRVSALPGVERAALAWSRPFGNMRNGNLVKAIAGRSTDELEVALLTVSPGYFDTMGIPVVAGRDFTRQDAPEDYRSPLLNVVVSASAATQLFGSPEAAVGQLVEPRFPKNARRQIIGVVGDVELNDAFTPPSPWMYAPLGDDAQWASVHLRVAPGMSVDAIAPVLRETMRAVDSTLPIYDLMPVADGIARQMSEDLLIGRLTMAFALIATFLAAVGLYGVLAQTVDERRREIGIRAALGAAPARMLALVTGDALRMTALGAIAGIGLTWGLGRYVESRLFGVELFDPLTFAAALATIAATSLVAAIVPARRASKVDPVSALRT